MVNYYRLYGAINGSEAQESSIIFPRMRYRTPLLMSTASARMRQPEKRGTDIAAFASGETSLCISIYRFTISPQMEAEYIFILLVLVWAFAPILVKMEG